MQCCSGLAAAVLGMRLQADTTRLHCWGPAAPNNCLQVEQFFKSPAAVQFRKPWHQLTGLQDGMNYKARPQCGGHARRLAGVAEGERGCVLRLSGYSLALIHLHTHALLPQAYWGEPEAGWLGLFQHQVRSGAAVVQVRLRPPWPPVHARTSGTPPAFCFLPAGAGRRNRPHPRPQARGGPLGHGLESSSKQSLAMRRPAPPPQPPAQRCPANAQACPPPPTLLRR